METMELRQYWQVIRRRLWIPIVLLGVVLAVSLLRQPASSVSYHAGMRFMMGLQPEPRIGNEYSYDKYYTWLTAEYLVDDVAQLVRSGAFAEAVSVHLAEQGIVVPAGAIQGSTQSGQLHRILTIDIGWHDAQQLAAIANAVVAILPTEVARHMAQVGTDVVQASLIDAPVVQAVGTGLRGKMELPLRVGLAGAAGLALVFVLDYLDTTVRGRRELEENGIRVLAEVPGSASPWSLRRRP